MRPALPPGRTGLAQHGPAREDPRDLSGSLPGAHGPVRCRTCGAGPHPRAVAGTSRRAAPPSHGRALGVSVPTDPNPTPSPPTGVR
ncbi:MAG: hypothetical protein M1837_005936, partial [Sclerophora amabilis]